MHPRTMRQQNYQQPTRKLHQRPHTRALMTTEYQERFSPPIHPTTLVSTSTNKDPSHPLTGKNTDVKTFRSYCVTNMWYKSQPKVPQPSMSPKNHRRCSSAPHNPAQSVENQMLEKVDYTSVYRNDFLVWKVNKQKPFKMRESLKVSHGLVLTNGNSTQTHSQRHPHQGSASSEAVSPCQEPQPFQSVTSYRCDYIKHQVQPRTGRRKPAHRSNKDLLPAVTARPKATWDMSRKLFDEGEEFFKQFKTWSLEPKLHTHRGAKESRRLPTDQKEERDWPKNTTAPEPAESRKGSPKPFSPRPKVSDTAVCNPSCSTTGKSQYPAENGVCYGFQCITDETEGSRRCWTTSLGQSMTWPGGDICAEPPEPHQVISHMVSSRS